VNRITDPEAGRKRRKTNPEAGRKRGRRRIFTDKRLVVMNLESPALKQGADTPTHRSGAQAARSDGSEGVSLVRCTFFSALHLFWLFEGHVECTEEGAIHEDEEGAIHEDEVWCGALSLPAACSLFSVLFSLLTVLHSPLSIMIQLSDN
jgi:hypothetical protein